MSLSRIYASKLYLTSSRQDKIHAAMNDPLNLELVQQLSDYLDDDSKEELAEAISSNQAKEEKAEKASAPDTSKNVFDDVDTSDLGGGHTSGGGSHSSFSAPMGGDPFGDAPDMAADGAGENASDNSSDDSSAPAPESSADIEESAEITGVEEIDVEENNPELQSGIIKKLLNGEDDTQGVARVDIDDSETWIYYDDKVNLNDIFDNVIALLKDSKYDMLKFSRLARTDNAVVFDIKE